MSERGKKTKILNNKQEEPEDWCFECKDGGQIVVCEQGNCLKVYHPNCIDQDDSLSEVKSWVCGWHYCINCRDLAKFYCLGCPNGSLCKKCLDGSNFTIFRGGKGLCTECSELILIIEQNLEHDSEGNKLSLNDRETYECLFKEYWDIVKDKENLTSNDVVAALDNSKKGKSFLLQSNSSEGGEEKEKESMSSDSYEDHTRKNKTIRRKRSNGQASRPSSSRGKPLLKKGYVFIEKLASNNVTATLENSKKRKNFLFQSNSSEGGEEKEKQLMSSDCDGDHTCKHKTIRRKRSNGQESRPSNSRGKPLLKKGLLYLKPSCFASINAKNINLVYLRQSLVQELSKQPESFMNKVVGAFVRVKVDRNNSRQRNSHHLVKVIGVLNDEISNGILLQISFTVKAVPISEISDADFIEEECEDLQQKVKAGLLPKLTVVELQEKAKVLHEDITKHRIATRLVCLQNQIDRANLRGRHREKYELLNEKEELSQKWKQEELLRKVPSVSAELIEEKYDPEEDEVETDSESQ